MAVADRSRLLSTGDATAHQPHICDLLDNRHDAAIPVHSGFLHGVGSLVRNDNYFVLGTERGHNSITSITTWWIRITDNSFHIYIKSTQQSLNTSINIAAALDQRKGDANGQVKATRIDDALSTPSVWLCTKIHGHPRQSVGSRKWKGKIQGKKEMKKKKIVSQSHLFSLFPFPNSDARFVVLCLLLCFPLVSSDSLIN